MVDKQELLLTPEEIRKLWLSYHATPSHYEIDWGLYVAEAQLAKVDRPDVCPRCEGKGEHLILGTPSSMQHCFACDGTGKVLNRDRPDSSELREKKIKEILGEAEATEMCDGSRYTQASLTIGQINELTKQLIALFDEKDQAEVVGRFIELGWTPPEEAGEMRVKLLKEFIDSPQMHALEVRKMIIDNAKREEGERVINSMVKFEEDEAPSFAGDYYALPEDDWKTLKELGTIKEE